MKKTLLAIAAVFAVSVSTAFANVEMDLNYYMKPVRNFTVDNSVITTDYSVPSFFGLEDSFSFFFGKNASMFDAGLGFGFGFDVFSNPETSTMGYSKTTLEAAGFDMFLRIGPVFRFTFGKAFSLSATPGLTTNIFLLIPKNSSNSANQEIGFGANVSFFTELAAKLWFVNSESGGFHFGLNAGALCEWNIAGSYSFASSTSSGDAAGRSSPVKNGFDLKFFVGLAFNFGSRGVDR
ncbi:hypothetical protein [Treponema sp.]|uniref:hypothetical protein n=1 Tax=Treponema sp. TaxID=166 RepID=UPI00298EC66D|nr:hypothetical protein [Treponema sp.]MCR5612848.1 hypothetical protein [Treponema sp.]